MKKLISADDQKLSEVSKAIGVPPFVQTDIAFLREYVMVMAPVAAALDILQGEQQCALGYVLPTISTSKKKLNCADIKCTASLRDSLLQGIQKRFRAYFADKEFLVAAVTHPRFKLSWIDDAELRANCINRADR